MTSTFGEGFELGSKRLFSNISPGPQSVDAHVQPLLTLADELYDENIRTSAEMLSLGCRTSSSSGVTATQMYPVYFRTATKLTLVESLSWNLVSDEIDLSSEISRETTFSGQGIRTCEGKLVVVAGQIY